MFLLDQIDSKPQAHIVFPEDLNDLYGLTTQKWNLTFIWTRKRPVFCTCPQWHQYYVENVIFSP